jgi:AcrR family transcriptional regulator
VPRRAKLRPDEPGLGRIEQAALELFGERGYDATSIAEIGERAGITKSVLYHYFGSKADLYAAVCTRQTADLIEAVREAVGDDPAQARLAPGVDAYLAFLAERPAAWRLLLRDRPADPDLAAVHERLEKERAAALTELLASPGKRTSKAQHLGLVAVAIRAFGAWWYDHPDVPRDAVAGAIMAFARAGMENVADRA